MNSVSVASAKKLMQTLYNNGVKCICCDLEGHMCNDLIADGPFCDRHHEILKEGERKTREYLESIARRKPEKKFIQIS